MFLVLYHCLEHPSLLGYLLSLCRVIVITTNITLTCNNCSIHTSCFLRFEVFSKLCKVNKYFSKMPDAFESAYPLSPSLNTQDIRARANSSSKNKRPVIKFFAGDETLEIPDKSEAGIDKPLVRVF